MHVVNLCIGYTLGIKENTETHEKLVDRKMTKVQEMVTLAGAFRHGLHIIKAR